MFPNWANLSIAALLVLFACAPAGNAAADDVVAKEGQGLAAGQARQRMVGVIRKYALASAEKTGRTTLDSRVLEALLRVPRHEFVTFPYKPFAYADAPLPLGYEQKIAQPFIIALMLDAAAIKPIDWVFETGSGSGYQAALLAELSSHVYSVEVVVPLAEAAQRNLQRLGYTNVWVKAGDGYYGWSEKGPYDVIIVKEAVDHIPLPLLRQLKPGGRMVLPLGATAAPGALQTSQMLTVITKQPNGLVSERFILPVRLTPYQGGERI